MRPRAAEYHVWGPEAVRLDGREVALVPGYLDFASGMLQWLPEKRKTAKELLQYPIFNSLNKKRSQWQIETCKIAAISPNYMVGTN